ncbi:MAG TPA: VanZ family protein [Acholeplasma sp.]|nr:VanZ family protein [Acholeplasma sp.]
MKKQNIILIGVVCLLHLFIWGQSLLTGAVSSSQSGFVVDVLYPVVSWVLPNLSVGTMSFIIRKLAHFTEYFILGLLLYRVYMSYVKGYFLLTIVVMHGLLVAAIDESIQLFTPNRSGELRDVLIDLLGVILAVVVIILFKAKSIHNKKHIIK